MIEVTIYPGYHELSDFAKELLIHIFKLPDCTVASFSFTHFPSGLSEEVWFGIHTIEYCGFSAPIGNSGSAKYIRGPNLFAQRNFKVMMSEFIITTETRRVKEY